MLFLMEPSLLKTAYEYCESVTRKHARSFYFAAKFLPREKRRAVYPIYAFCRHVDDAVDEDNGSAESRREAVARWESRLRDVYTGKVDHNSEQPSDQDLVFIAWNDLLKKYRFDIKLPIELIKGVIQDTEIDRYATFDDLYVYCYRVASTVGLMSSEILGYSEKSALGNAEALGIAMQLTNILRDVGEDAERGRIYLPREDLDRFGVSDKQIIERRIDANFIELMKFEIARAREFYRRGNAGIGYLDRDSRFTVAAASTVYSGILKRIEKQRYDVFAERARTSFGWKVRQIPSAYRLAGRSALFLEAGTD